VAWEELAVLAEEEVVELLEVDISVIDERPRFVSTVHITV
jgi:hypothetical protein